MSIKIKLKNTIHGSSAWRVSFLTACFVSLLLAGHKNASGGTLYAVRGSDDHLVSIDTNTFALSDIGPLGVAFSFGGLAYDASSDTLYMIDGRGAESLYAVNQSTGAAALIGGHGINDLFGLAFDSTNNVLYAGQFSSPDGLYTMNTATGAATFVGSPGSPLSDLGGLAYDSQRDRLVAMNDGFGDLYEIDRGTAAPTLLFDGPFVSNGGLAYDADQDLYWDLDYSGNLHSYDPSSGLTPTLEANFGNLAWDGLTYQSSSSVPEPSTYVLGVLGLLTLGLFGWRRKRG